MAVGFHKHHLSGCFLRVLSQDYCHVLQRDVGRDAAEAAGVGRASFQQYLVLRCTQLCFFARLVLPHLTTTGPLKESELIRELRSAFCCVLTRMRSKFPALQGLGLAVGTPLHLTHNLFTYSHLFTHPHASTQYNPVPVSCWLWHIVLIADATRVYSMCGWKHTCLRNLRLCWRRALQPTGADLAAR